MGSFEKRRGVKPRRMIDASVIIGALTNRTCQRCLSKLTYQHHGYVTHAILGEIFRGATLHIPDFQSRCILYQWVDDLLVEERLRSLPIVKVSPEEIDEVQRKLPFLTLDDAFHLVEMRLHGLSEFVTIDRELTDSHNKKRLSQLGIKTLLPS